MRVSRISFSPLEKEHTSVRVIEPRDSVSFDISVARSHDMVEHMS